MSEIENSFNNLAHLANEFDNELTTFYIALTKHINNCVADNSKSSEPLEKYMTELLQFGPKITVAGKDLKKLTECIIIFASKFHPDTVKKAKEIVFNKSGSLHKDIDCNCVKCVQIKNDVVEQVKIISEKAIKEFRDKNNK